MGKKAILVSFKAILDLLSKWRHSILYTLISYPRGSVQHVTDLLVVKVLNVNPFHAFRRVGILLLSQDQLDEELLHLLIAVVDTELFEAGL